MDWQGVMKFKAQSSKLKVQEKLQMPRANAGLAQGVTMELEALELFLNFEL